MVNLIQDKIAANHTYYVNHRKAQVPLSVTDSTVVRKNDESQQRSDNWKDILAPMGLIAGGAIFLYYGIKTPGKVKLFKNNVKNRIFRMESELSEYSTFIKKTTEEYYKGASAFIKKYKEQRYISPASFLFNIKKLKDPKLVSRAMDIAFEAISRSDIDSAKGGASDIDNFGVLVHRITREVSDIIEHKKEKSKLVINDYVHLPKFKNNSHSDLVEASENQLISTATSITQQMDKLKDENLHSIIKTQYTKMADAITTARKLKTEAKELSINLAFEHIRSLLKLKDFFPSYYKLPTTDEFIKLNPQQLKPHSLPKSLQEYVPHNIFLATVAKKDFNTFTDDDIYEIFYKSYYNNNLKDLRYLIDRLRIKQVIAKTSEDTTNAESFGVIIAKLEYLANKLNEFGTEEIIKKCQRNFHNMSVEQRRAALYYVTTVSKRLGFETIKDMDEYFSKNNDIYKTLSIRDYIDIFEKTPELYFM